MLHSSSLPTPSKGTSPISMPKVGLGPMSLTAEPFWVIDLVNPPEDTQFASKVVVNSNAPVGECLKWVKGAVEALHLEGLVNIGSGDNFLEEFLTFVGGSHTYVTSSRFPNVMESQHYT
ncbi:uncharacterized protein BJ212DRAFT_1484735 [Suillus subaureus]|uniref:Uncharacterized protein n=1 Tax=Suillus subaureus TaxID=48587 RepID=A0A9P7E1Y7_9AGAM|nr:uncharacterized protein BJ212DRAFT_1484735 [Suillus subaureus]KAG1808878.1 hypothetical protein BJ212DRAFT_1484735 [Suillus subaureus]